MQVKEEDSLLMFDITCAESSLKFLSSFIEVNENKICSYFKKTQNDDLHNFLDAFNINLSNKSIDNVYLLVNHITTNNDECCSIRDFGLINLQQALSVDTPLNKYIKKFDIGFDISNNLMNVRDNLYEIRYNSSFYETSSKNGKLNSIARKIYFDYQINGFFYIEDFKSYGGYVHLRPEFIYDLSLLGKDSDKFVNEWIETSKTYLVRFKAPIHYFTYYTFYDDINKYKEDIIDKLEIKRWLVRKALTVYWNNLNNTPCSEEITAYLKPEVSIPLKLITEIVEI